MEQADEADKSAELHGSEREEPESATRTRQKASKAAETVRLELEYIDKSFTRRSH